MDSPISERALAVLEIIGRASDPVGSWHVKDELETYDIDVSSATVGRLLNQLENRGFLTKHSIRGRTLTEAGRAAIKRAYNNQNIEAHKRKLNDLINSNVLRKFLMALEARQAIERATSRLAAERITEEQLQHLRDTIDHQRKHHEQGKSIATDDIEFHKTIAEASGNEALASLYVILSMLGQQSELFEHLRSKVHPSLMTAHVNVLRAIEARDPDRAEHAMEQHLEQLKQDVKTYWDRFYGPTQPS